LTETISQERRKHKRWNLVFSIPVVEISTQQTIGQLEEISSRGFRLNSQFQIPVEQEYHLGLISTPDLIDMEFVGFVARSKWCQTNMHDLEQTQYSIGFDIINIAPHDAEVLECIVERNGARDLAAFLSSRNN
jgi:hypothetical protein